MKDKQETIETYKKKEVVKFFDKERKKYLFQRYKHKVEASFLKNTIEKVRGGKVRVLDVACGTGRMLPEVFSTKKEINYTGIDTSREMMNELEVKAVKISKKGKIKTIVADAAKIPFEDNSFDVTYSFHLLWHIEKEEQEKVIHEMIRVTKRGGFIVFDILNKNFFWENVKELFGRKKAKGLYKMGIREAKSMIKEAREFKIRKLSDAPIKNGYLYQIFNIVNLLEMIMPPFLYHMIFIRARK